MSGVLRNLPSVNELLESPPLKSLVNRVSRNTVVSGVRRFLDDLHGQVQGATGLQIPSPTELAERIAQWIAAAEQPPLRPVVNATGILLHDDLGPPPLAEQALEAIAAVAGSYASGEFNLPAGEHSRGDEAVQRLLVRLTGAEAAAVVHTSAAALFVTLAAIAAGREVLLSKGQLVQLGDGCRLSDVIGASGALLGEVGATNLTRLADYAAAIGERTAALLRIHADNYQIVGCTEETPLSELVALGRRHTLPVIDVLGAGGVIDVATYGVADVQMVGASIQAGAEIVLFSGDKLLGGPPCGIIAGKRAAVQKIVNHPLGKLFRVDKLTLAALDATLRLYADPELAERSVPLLTLLATPLENLKNRAERLAPQIAATGVVSVEIVEGTTHLSSAPVPTQTLKTISLALTPASGNAAALAASLRAGTPAVIGRVRDPRLLLDLRSVAPRYDAPLVAAVQALARKPASPVPAPELPAL